MDFKVEPVHHCDASHSDGEITTYYGDLAGTEVTKSNSAMIQPGFYNTKDNPSEIPAVTVEEAIQGIIIVIHYLQAHPPDQDIQVLFDLLDYINKQAGHAIVQIGNDRANDIHNLNLNKTLTNNMKIEPIAMMESVEEIHDSSDITPLEHGTPNVRFKRKASQKDLNTSTIGATHDGAIPAQLEPDIVISNELDITVQRNANELYKDVHVNQDAITSSEVTSLEHGTPNVRSKRKTSLKDVNTSTICATHDAIPEQLEPDVLISNQHEIISNELYMDVHVNQDAITSRGKKRNICLSSLDYLPDSPQRTEHIKDETHCKKKMKSSTKTFKSGKEISKQIHQCKVCDFQCENRRKLLCHVKGHRKYNCKEYGRSSTGKARLVRHMLRNRNKKLPESDIGDIVHNTKKTSSLYQCKSCDFQSEECKELWDHKLSHSEYVCKECGRQCRHKSVLAKHMKIHERKISLGKNKSIPYVPPRDMFYIDEDMQIYKCKLCDYHCDTKPKLRYHAESHRDYTCQVCGKKSTCKDGLLKHMSRHDKKPLLPCHYCKQGFEEAEQLMEHIKIHSGKSLLCGMSVVCSTSSNKIYMYSK